MSQKVKNPEPEQLLDFLAENFLEQGKSIDYLEVSGFPAFSSFIAGEKITFLSLPNVSRLQATQLKNFGKLIIPVLKEEEQKRLLRQVKKYGLQNVEIYRLSLPERYAFYSRAFQKKAYSVK